MIYTGLDWSGDPGDPVRRPGVSSLLLVVAASLADDQLAMLRAGLAKGREERRLPEYLPFKHLTSKQGVRQAFFEEVSRLPIRIHAKIVEKREWSREYLAATDGLTRIVDAIIDLT